MTDDNAPSRRSLLALVIAVLPFLVFAVAAWLVGSNVWAWVLVRP